MKTMVDKNKIKISGVSIDPSLDKFDDVVLFPKKLAKANAQLKKSGFPKLNDKKHNR